MEETNMKTIKHLDHELYQAGYGAYPYDCILKDKYPRAMIYMSDHCWTADIADIERKGK
jgi:hypothetical protein